jgi:TATA-binding protein-associated factor
MKNPKTATARAARMLKARHKLLLSGTPVQNRVHELWAVFDWLLPNYLGSESDFAKCYGRDITRGHLPGASPTDIRNGMEKLKSLHQQVLPFILRREKGSVLMELPPKTVTDIPCNMTSHQTRLYTQICESHESKGAMGILQRYLDRLEKNDSACNLEDIARGGKNVLKSLSKLRMICTHPSLLNKSKYGKLQNPDFQRFDLSGKLLALNDLLRASQIYHDDFAAVDNDQSLIYIGNEGAESNEGEIFDVNDDDVCEMNGKKNEGSKCLIFAQFTSSLDCIEDLLFKPHMPSLQYLRLDGTVLPEDRTFIVDQFHTDESIKCMLLTTKVGGLGLNLQIADTVIFLECDWNPHVDLQAMDRAHRIGQTKVRMSNIITS